MSKAATVANENIHPSMNGAAQGAPQMEAKPLTVDDLRQRLEKITGGLNTLRSQRETLTQQLEDTNLSIGRTEGAILMLQSLLQEASAEGQGG